MKKYIILIILIALSVSPVHAQTPTYSFYRPSIVTGTGLVLYNTNGWTTFSEASFDTKQNGLFTLTGDAFTTSYVGIVKLTGNCRQSKPSDIALRIAISGYIAPVLITRTSDEAFTFSFPFIAGNFQLQGYNFEVGRYDVLKCDMVIEAVG